MQAARLRLLNSLATRFCKCSRTGFIMNDSMNCWCCLSGARRSAHHGHGAVKPVATYNDLPSPQGSWQTQYDTNQRKYNGHLALGFGVLAATILFGQVNGLFFLNWTIPEKPAVIDSYKE